MHIIYKKNMSLFVYNCKFKEVIVMQTLRKGRHAVYSLQYHIIFVVKYRRAVIDEDILSLFEDICKKILQNNNGNLIQMNGEEDHIHILAELPPDKVMSDIIGAMKTQTSRMVRKYYNDRIQDKLWGKAFWSPSYFVATTGGATLEVLEQYVKDQGKPSRPYHKTGRYKKKKEI